MGYQALYRKYRPRRFEDVLGQEHITTILKNQVASGRTAHAYIFSGSRGTGKTTTAKILARAVNCTENEGGEPCGKCAACLASADDSVDIIELDAASNNGVENIRAIIDRSRFAPLSLSHKVYIIDEAHMLSNAAENALLKTLEEPPSNVMFILATTEPERIAATIISRCQRFDFHRITISDIVKCTKATVEAAGAHIDDAGLAAIARAAGGGMRDALSIADQCLALCGNDVSARDVYGVIGSMESEFLFSAAERIIDYDREGALKCIDGVSGAGRDLSVFASDLARHFRVLLMAKLCPGSADILECTVDEMQRYAEQAAGASERKLLRATELLLDASCRMRSAVLPRVLLECAVVRITTPEEEALTPEIAMDRLDKLEKRLELLAAAPPAPHAPAAVSATAVSAPAASVPAESADAAPKAPAAAKAPAAPAGGKAIWTQVQKTLFASNPTLSVLAMKATSWELADGLLTVGFEKKTFCDAFQKKENAAAVAAVLASAAPGVSCAFAVRTAHNSAEEQVKKVFGDMIEIIE